LGLPKIEKTSDHVAAASTTTAAVVAGQDTPSEEAPSEGVFSVRFGFVVIKKRPIAGAAGRYEGR
jgi:hypothetical protein